jgi:mono/diheme cytochrome c family protein
MMRPREGCTYRARLGVLARIIGTNLLALPFAGCSEEGVRSELDTQIEMGIQVVPGPNAGSLRAEVLARGIPGAGAVCEVGEFLPGGAMHDVPELAAFTEPGRVFASSRVLVASTSNFGAPLARPGEAGGSILSLSTRPSGPVLLVPSEFASSGSQASVADGDIQLMTAQSPNFAHPINTPATFELTSVGLPTGISLNNGSGRPWFSNAPLGSSGDGTVTVTNPSGVPTAIFSGARTNRAGTSHAGIPSGVLGTTLLSKSPDESARPVFAAVLADGSVVQVHVTKGVDPLAPAGTVTPVPNVGTAAAESTRARVVAREGMAFNWVPTMNLFIADPLANRLVVLDLSDDGQVFSVSKVRALHSRLLDVPIDVAPAVRETAHASFASNTMLGAGSDLYVLNRGDNSIVRMRQDGEVIARRQIEANVAGFRVSGLGLSADSETLYITATTPGRGGVLLRASAFGQSQTTRELIAEAHARGAATVDDVGSVLFSLDVTPAQGLGPLFNAASCGGCHNDPFPGGMGVANDTMETLVGRVRRDGSFDNLEGKGGPVARARSIAELGEPCKLPTGPTPRANVLSKRSAMTLRGNALIDAIHDRVILTNLALQPESIRGRVNRLEDGRVGRFGWKADVATFVEFVGLGYRNESGLTNPLVPHDEVSGCGQSGRAQEIDALPLTMITKFVQSLDPPTPSAECLGSAGAALFRDIGCAGCHTPQLAGRGTTIHLYSDLLLHDMGPALDDSMVQGSAGGGDWRTMPLWRASERRRFLHDGRASTLTEAIVAHGGQAASSTAAFGALPSDERQALLQFLGCI